MLDAVVKRKAHRVLMSREDRTPLEDIITSMVFGPLAFLPPTEAMRAFALAFDPELNPGWEPVSHSFEFWPRGEKDRVEPDLKVDFQGIDAERLTLLIEVKWDAPFSDNQALREWRLFGGEAVRHVLLARDRLRITSHLQGAQDSAGPEHPRWNQRCVIVTWAELSGRLRTRQASPPSGALERWIKLATGFLAAMGERPFEGFAHIVDGRPLPSPVAPLFWSTAICWPTGPLALPADRVF